jgi:glucosylceramidase
MRSRGSGWWRTLLLTTCCWPLLGLGQEVRRVVSSKTGARLASQPSLQFETRLGPGTNTFAIQETATLQTIAGFGASMLEAGMVCLNTLPPESQEKLLQSLFDPVHGAGFSAMKVPLAGTDFSSAGPWYTYDDTPGDIDLKHFSIVRDLGPNGMLTFIQRARKYGQFALQSPMDYPPDWMLFDVKTNQDVNPVYYDALARYYLRYLQEYKKHGIEIDYLSLFNEPGVYTKISYSEIQVLLRDHVAPLLARSGLKTRLTLSESPNRQEAWERYPVVLDAPETRRCVAALAYHGYDHTHFDAIARLHARYPELPLWMTELCYAYPAGTPKTMKLPRPDFEDGDFWGGQIFSDLEAGASAWIYWNLLLDQDGGPWMVSVIHGDPAPNVQHPVVIVNRNTHEITYTGCYYYLAHFSKFVRPGAVRLAVKGSARHARCLVFRTPEGGRVAQLMNSRDGTNEVWVTVGGKSIHLSLPPVSITTCLWQP